MSSVFYIASPSTMDGFVTNIRPKRSQKWPINVCLRIRPEPELHCHSHWKAQYNKHRSTDSRSPILATIKIWSATDVNTFFANLSNFGLTRKIYTWLNERWRSDIIIIVIIVIIIIIIITIIIAVIVTFIIIITFLQLIIIITKSLLFNYVQKLLQILNWGKW